MRINYVGKALLIETDGKRILAVGDMHLGYEGSLQASGYLVLNEMLKEIIEDFDEIFAKVGKVDEIVLLGDLKHDFGRINEQEWRDILKLFDYLSRKGKVIVIKGNHDKMIEPVARKRNVSVLDYYVVNGVGFLHGDKKIKEVEDCKVWILGHGHPAISLKDGVKEEKYKCFIVGKFKGREIIIVSSFLPLIEGSDPRDFNLGLAWKFNLNKFNVKVVDGLEVRDFGELGKL